MRKLEQKAEKLVEVLNEEKVFDPHSDWGYYRALKEAGCYKLWDPKLEKIYGQDLENIFLLEKEEKAIWVKRVMKESEPLEYEWKKGEAFSLSEVGSPRNK